MSAMQMTRREFINAGAGAMAAVAATRPLSASGRTTGRTGRKPNLVFVFADQLRACSVGCMGNKDVITPNLDKLASEGLLVTNALSCAPVCTPYRAQLLTGRYAHTTGVIHNDIRLPDSETLLPELMKKAGYATGYIGKWHLSGPSKNGEKRPDPVDKTNRRGWDFWAVRNCSHKHHQPAYWLNDARDPIEVPGWEPDVQTDLAVEYIKKNRKNPFCLFVSYGPPHNPYKAPAAHLARYKGKKLNPRPNAKGTKNLAQYYAMTTSLDDCIGRVAKALDDAGIAGDTILCFSSDHGDMLGSQGQRLKQRPWEESVNIPFILRYPREVRSGQKRDWLLNSVDVMPTLLGLCGVSVPRKVEGMDWSPAMRGGRVKEPDAAYLFNYHYSNYHSPGHWRGIRTKEWTYAMRADRDWILYNLKDDPYQLKNLVDNAKHAKQKKKLRDRLAAMRRELGEDIPMN